MNPSLTLPNFFQFPSFGKMGRGRFFNEPLPHPPLAFLIFPPLDKRGNIGGDEKTHPNLPLHP
jgi:hypothetical protein